MAFGTVMFLGGWAVALGSGFVGYRLLDNNFKGGWVWNEGHKPGKLIREYGKNGLASVGKAVLAPIAGAAFIGSGVKKVVTGRE